MGIMIEMMMMMTNLTFDHHDNDEIVIMMIVAAEVPIDVSLQLLVKVNKIVF